MPAKIHPTAIVESGAELADDVEIGAFAYIGAKVKIGPRTTVFHHATVEGNTTLGEENEVWPYAYLGGRSQDLKFTGGFPRLTIGDRNVFREFCTVHHATSVKNATVIGSDNLFCAYAHIAHECQVGNHVVMSNNGTLAGHVVVEDRAIIGGLTAIHQFCRVGRFAMLGGCSKLVQDMPPFMIGDGNPFQVRTYNKIGLARNGFTEEQIRTVRRMFKVIYREGLNRSQALAKLRSAFDPEDEVVRQVVDFMVSSKRGLA